MPISDKSSTRNRLVVKKLFARQQHEGFGAVVRRSIGRFEFRYFDPFLVLDEFSVSAPAGFPDHPHRGWYSCAQGWSCYIPSSISGGGDIYGFETVTYMLQGEILHEDCEGHKGVIKEGGLQWMTAGKGIVHSEMPSSNSNGITHNKGLQLWINLSSKHKLVEPSYQEIESKDIAETEKDGVRVRIIAGEWNGVKSKISTRTPTMYLDSTLTPDSRISQIIPHHWNAFVYVLQGQGRFGDSKSQQSVAAAAHNLLVLSLDGDRLEAWNDSDSGLPLRFILVAGEPLSEPMVQFGPFVMNTQEEIDQTIDDFENFTNGFENARHWKSQAASALGLF